MADRLERIDHGETHQRLVIDEYNFEPFHDTRSMNERSRDTGRQSVKVVPFPTSLSTRILPPWRSTMPKLTDRPRPVPSPSLLVEKKGSKILGRTVGGMPDPVSHTSITQIPSTTDVRIVSTPPSFIAWTAFNTRFISTCSIMCRSTMTFGSP